MRRITENSFLRRGIAGRNERMKKNRDYSNPFPCVSVAFPEDDGICFLSLTKLQHNQPSADAEKDSKMNLGVVFSCK